MPGANQSQSERLERLFEFARLRRGWTKVQLADALGRDPSRIIPSSGNPKLDIVVKLAAILDWPVHDVIEAIDSSDVDDIAYIPGAPLDPAVRIDIDALDFESLYQRVLVPPKRKDFCESIYIARRMRRIAATPEELGMGWAFEAVRLVDIGHIRAVDACRQGLDIQGIPIWLRQNLETNLTLGLYQLRRDRCALAMANLLIGEIESMQDIGVSESGDLALLYETRGGVHRRAMRLDNSIDIEHLESSRGDYDRAIQISDEFEGRWAVRNFKGRRLHAQAGLIEVDVAAGELSPMEGIERVLEIVSAHEDFGEHGHSELESVGWACIYGCNIAIHHLSGRDKHQTFAVLSNKALDIADHITHWALREHAFAQQMHIHRDLKEETGFDIPLALDEDDMARLITIMGHFPKFKSTAWSLLNGERSMRPW